MTEVADEHDAQSTERRLRESREILPQLIVDAPKSRSSDHALFIDNEVVRPYSFLLQACEARIARRIDGAFVVHQQAESRMVRLPADLESGDASGSQSTDQGVTGWRQSLKGFKALGNGVDEKGLSRSCSAVNVEQERRKGMAV